MYAVINTYVTGNLAVTLMVDYTAWAHLSVNLPDVKIGEMQFVESYKATDETSQRALSIMEERGMISKVGTLDYESGFYRGENALHTNVWEINENLWESYGNTGTL